MIRADSPGNSSPMYIEGTEMLTAPLAYIRGLGTALGKWETLKIKNSQREIAQQEGEGKEINYNAPLVIPGMIFLVDGNRISQAEPELGVD